MDGQRALEKGAHGDDVPLAFGENITHTNADMSEMVLGAMQSVSRDTALPPMPIKLHRTDTCFDLTSPDPGEDGLVRHALVVADVAGLQMDELRWSSSGAAHPLTRWWCPQRQASTATLPRSDGSATCSWTLTCQPSERSTADEGRKASA